MAVAMDVGTALRTTAVCGSSFCSAAVADGETDVAMDVQITTDVDAAANFSSAENPKT